MIDRIGVRSRPGALTPGRDGAERTVVCSCLLRAKEDRDSSAPGRGDEPLGRLDCPMRKYAASIGISLVDLNRRTRPATIDKIIEIDGEQRRPRSDEGFAAPSRIETQVVLRDYVVPAMVVESVN